MREYKEWKGKEGTGAVLDVLGKGATDKIEDGIVGTGFAIKKGMSWLPNNDSFNLSQNWSDYKNWKEGLKTGTVLNMVKDATNETGYKATVKVADAIGIDRKDAIEGAKIIRDGTTAVASEIFHNPAGLAQNVTSFVYNGLQRINPLYTHLVEKKNAIPKDIKDPVIFAIYHVGGEETPPGHAALWYRGETIDATSGGADFRTMFHPNKGEAGQTKEDWYDSPFEFSVDKNCDLYVVDAAKLGFDTPEKKEKFLQDIRREQKNPNWDLNDRNCAHLVNKVTGDVLLTAPRLQHPRLKNLDMPLSMGAKLDRMCITGDAAPLSPDAIKGYGTMLAVQHGKPARPEENTRAIADSSSSKEGLKGMLSHYSQLFAESESKSSSETNASTEQNKVEEKGFMQRLLENYSQTNGEQSKDKVAAVGKDTNVGIIRKMLQKDY